MSDEQAHNTHIDARFNRIESQIADVARKADRNHDATKKQYEALTTRVGALELQNPGHTDDEIVQIIDERLAVFARDVLPGIVKGAIHEGLRLPLSKVDDNTRALNDLNLALAPVIRIGQTVTSVRSGLLWIGGPLTVVLGLLALANHFWGLAT